MTLSPAPLAACIVLSVVPVAMLWVVWDSTRVALKMLSWAFPAAVMASICFFAAGLAFGTYFSH